MFRSLLVFLVGIVILSTPFAASAATVDFFGPIVPAECTCNDGKTETNPEGFVSAPDWGCVLQTVQNAITFGVSILVIVITLTIAYAGILMIVNPTNPNQREQGRSMVTNAIIGLIIVLCSWLLVDFVMKAFYNADAAGRALGDEAAPALPWNRILGDGAVNKEKWCFQPTSVTPDPGQNTGGGLEPGGSDSGPTTAPNNGEATEKPATPMGFQANTMGSNWINLSWEPVSNADAYEIKRAPEQSGGGEPNSGYQTIGSVFAPKITYSDKTLHANTRYYYQLTAKNEAGSSIGIAEANARTSPSSSSSNSDSSFDYQAGIQAQIVDASPTLKSLLTCMVAKVPANVGQISSISDSRITNGSKTFEQCAAGGQGAGCAHQVNSCHYGGETCTGKSYAVDFGDEQNATVLTSAANACGASLVLNEGDHIHVSVGGNCGCDGD